MRVFITQYFNPFTFLIPLFTKQGHDDNNHAKGKNTGNPVSFNSCDNFTR